MAIYALGDVVPSIDPDAYVHPDAVVIGDVTLGPETTVWPSAVLRGDYGAIVVGARTSIQDGTVIHAGPGFPTMVGSGCVVGHLVHLEGCTLEDECLVGIGGRGAPPRPHRLRRHRRGRGRGPGADARPAGRPRRSGSRPWSSRAPLGSTPSPSRPPSTSGTASRYRADLRRLD